ncbi:MAG: leucine-rich repeat domain-containing protein [Anaerolineae bacterium]|nr:leucine-rich repeat domain-containing protein [Anaerolineae bacterium]
MEAIIKYLYPDIAYNHSMRNFLHRLFHNKTVFTIANIIFWLGLGSLLLTDPFRLAVGGSLLTLVTGSYLLYTGLSPKIANGMAQPSLSRTLAVIFGLVATVVAILVLINTLSNGIPTRRRAVREKLTAAARGYTLLDLRDLGLREIPPEVWKLEHLISLDVSDNRLKALPPEIARLTNLETLRLDGNRLESLPPEIGQLTHLKWLDLDDNRLTTLPPEFAHLQSLTHLQIQYNRWTAFPNVILELPNLEQLFLAGNRLGELPLPITQRAEAGALDLWYKPYASRLDWATISVIGFTFVLPVILSWGLDRWWARREYAQRQAAQQGNEVFMISPLFRGETLFVVCTLSAISLFVFIVALNGPQTGITMNAGVGIPLLFAPLIVGGLIFALRHSGMVILSAESVTLQRMGREQRVRYNDVVALRSRSNPLIAALLIRGEGRTLRIPRMVENLPRLTDIVFARVPPAVRDAALEKTVR